MSLKDLLRYPLQTRRWKGGIAKESDCKPITVELLEAAKIGSPSNSPTLEFMGSEKFKQKLKELENPDLLKEGK